MTLSSQQQKQQHRQTLHHVGFGSGPGEDIRVGSGSTASGVTNGIANLVSSKYLKAAQELLDEVVKADSNDINTKSQLFSSKKGTSVTDTKAVGESSTGAREGSDGGGEASGKRTMELGTTERQEIQMKKAKLSSMLHEVTNNNNNTTYTDIRIIYQLVLSYITHEVDFEKFMVKIFSHFHFILYLYYIFEFFQITNHIKLISLLINLSDRLMNTPSASNYKMF